MVGDKGSSCVLDRDGDPLYDSVVSTVRRSSKTTHQWVHRLRTSNLTLEERKSSVLRNYKAKRKFRLDEKKTKTGRIEV